LRLSSKSKRVLAATSTSVKSLKVVDLRVYSSLQPAKFPRCVFHHRGQIILLDGEAPLETVHPKSLGPSRAAAFAHFTQAATTNLLKQLPQLMATDAKLAEWIVECQQALIVAQLSQGQQRIHQQAAFSIERNKHGTRLRSLALQITNHLVTG
jgi:hypothetical protein